MAESRLGNPFGSGDSCNHEIDAITSALETRDRAAERSGITVNPAYTRQRERQYDKSVQEKQRRTMETERELVKRNQMLLNTDPHDYIARLNVIEPDLQVPSFLSWRQELQAKGMNAIILGPVDIDVAIAYTLHAIPEKSSLLSDGEFLLFTILVQHLQISTKLHWPVVEEPVEDIPFSTDDYRRYRKGLIDANAVCEIMPNVLMLDVPPSPFHWSIDDERRHCEQIAPFQSLILDGGLLIPYLDGVVGYRKNNDTIESHAFPIDYGNDAIYERCEKRISEEPKWAGPDLTAEKLLPYVLELQENPELDLSSISPTNEYFVRRMVNCHRMLYSRGKEQWEDWLREQERKEQQSAREAEERKAAAARVKREQEAAAQIRAEAAKAELEPEKTVVPDIWMPDVDTGPIGLALWTITVCDFKSINDAQISYLIELMTHVHRDGDVVGVMEKDLDATATSLGMKPKEARRIAKNLISAGVIAPITGRDVDYVLVSPGIRAKALEKDLKGAQDAVEKMIIDGSSKEGFIYRLGNNTFAAEYKTARGKTKTKTFGTTSEKVARTQIAAWRAEEKKRDEERQAQKKRTAEVAEKKAETTEEIERAMETAPEKKPETDEATRPTVKPMRRTTTREQEIRMAEQGTKTDRIFIVTQGSRIVGFANSEDEVLEYEEGAMELIAAARKLGMEGGDGGFDYQEVERIQPFRMVANA